MDARSWVEVITLTAANAFALPKSASVAAIVTVSRLMTLIEVYLSLYSDCTEITLVSRAVV